MIKGLQGFLMFLKNITGRALTLLCSRVSCVPLVAGIPLATLLAVGCPVCAQINDDQSIALLFPNHAL